MDVKNERERRDCKIEQGEDDRKAGRESKRGKRGRGRERERERVRCSVGKVRDA